MFVFKILILLPLKKGLGWDNEAIETCNNLYFTVTYLGCLNFSLKKCTYFLARLVKNQHY